jgi:hypothetical protein
MNKRTRILALAALLAVIAGSAPVWAQSEADFQIKEEDGALTITKYVGWDTELVIPASIGGKTVRAIGESAFEKAKLTSVTLPISVTYVGGGLGDCSIIIGANVKEVRGSFGDFYNKNGKKAGRYTVLWYGTRDTTWEYSAQ